MKRSEEISLILDLLSKAVANLQDDDLEKVARDTHSIEVKIVRNRSGVKQPTNPETFNVEDVAKKLEEFSDRESADNHLRQVTTTKKSLEQLARHFDIAVSKQDKIDDLVHKIIESTVGAKLRSSAIRGPEA